MTNLANSTTSILLGDNGALQLLDAMEALVLLLTESGKILECNEICEQLTGFTETELINRSFAGVLATQAEMNQLQTLVSQVASGDFEGSIDSSILTKCGEDIRIRWTGVRLNPSQNSQPLLLVTGTNVTLEHQAITQLEAAKAETAQLQEMVTQLRNDNNVLDASRVERRADCRLRFAGTQRAAPYDGNTFPSDTDYLDVNCYDVSARGISFYLPNPPTTDEFVLELGSGTNSIYFIAGMRHMQLVPKDTGTLFLIGCKFLGRI